MNKQMVENGKNRYMNNKEMKKMNKQNSELGKRVVLKGGGGGGGKVMGGAGP